MPFCVDTLAPKCQVYEETLDNTRTEISECEEVNGVWTVPAGVTVCFALRTDPGNATPSELDNMSAECVNEGFNLEFLLVRTAAAAAGTTVSASCERSTNKKVDCPLL